MSRENRVEVINKMGWRKEFVVEKPIVQIGRDARNDIVLDDGLEHNVAARHAQLLPSTANPQGMRLLNLSDQEIVVTPSGAGQDAQGTTVGARSSAELANGATAKIGDFTLVFYGGDERSDVVKLKVDMPSTVLTLDQPLAGTLSIEHVGNQAAVQFKIELEGLPIDSYELGPGPVLFPNAEKQITFRLRHPKRPSPPAGAHTITFHVTAPDAYPGERASISQEITIAPYFQHKLRVMVMDTADFRLS